MAITKFDRAVIRTTGLQERAVAALQALATEHGLAVQFAGGAFDDLSLTVKVKFTVTDKASTEDVERKRFEEHAFLFGLKPEDFGAQFVSGGHIYQIAGLALSRSAKPVKLLRMRDGKAMIATAESVVGAIAIARARRAA